MLNRDLLNRDLLNRDQIDARILNLLQAEFCPEYKVRGLRTKWIGQNEGEKVFSIRYFLTSKKFIGGVRYDKISVRGREVRIIKEEWEN